MRSGKNRWRSAAENALARLIMFAITFPFVSFLMVCV
jgi:hypothetical protein